MAALFPTSDTVKSATKLSITNKKRSPPGAVAISLSTVIRLMGTAPGMGGDSIVVVAMATNTCKTMNE